MLNGRLYLQAWLVAVVGLLVAFLTLQPPTEDTTPAVVTTFNATEALTAARAFGAAVPVREPGTPEAGRAADWVAERMRSLAGTVRTPGGASAADRVATLSSVARINRQNVVCQDVFLTLPADAEPASSRSTRNILVVAPRDTPRGVTGGTTGTGILLELAQTAFKYRYRHPLIFLSTDCDTVGSGGMRWYLQEVEPTRIAGMVVLGPLGEGGDGKINIWMEGATRQTLGLRQLAERAIRGAGATPSGIPSMSHQLLRFAVPQAHGEQRAGIDRGVPAVTLSSLEERELPPGLSAPDRDRMDQAGEAALGLLNLLDARERANAPDASLAYAGKTLRPSVARLALLLLCLPLVVMALDAAARIRRARVRVSAGLRAVAWRFVTPLAALFTGYVLARVGMLRLPDIGRPPSPAEVELDGQAYLAIALVALISIGLWIWIRPRVVRAGANPPAEAAGALVWLAGIALVAWVIAPFSLVLILPAAHAALAATVVPRRWQVGALAAVALAGPLAVIWMTADVIDRNPGFAVWYLVQTAVSGGRGWAGPVLAVLVGVCVVSLATLVVFRARKGLVTGRVRRTDVRSTG